MREVNTFPPKPPTKKEFREFFERSSKERIIQIKANEKSRKENLKHLITRSKELGKEIPLELQVMFSVYPIPMVGSDFIERWKEWL